MAIIDKTIVLSLFEDLNRNGIEYVLLRNLGNEFPSNHSSDKDMDILVHKRSQKPFHELMSKGCWKKIQHPWDFGNNFIFLYAMDPFEMYIKSNLNLDVCYQLNCRSINDGEWMPLDQSINDSVWINKQKNSVFPWFEMCREDQLVHLITRCIFDKKRFPTEYINEIDALYQKVDLEMLREKLKYVFFKFTPVLMKNIENSAYENLVNKYLQFSDY